MYSTVYLCSGVEYETNNAVEPRDGRLGSTDN